MKLLLAILLSFIITEAPVLARYEYTIPGNAQSLSGVYAGILIPIEDTLLIPTATDFGSNSLGLFTLALPTIGLGAGNVVVFSNGNTFSGTLQALINPDAKNPGITGVLNATYSYTLSTIVTTSSGASVVTQGVTAGVQGSFDAAAVYDANSVGNNGLDLSGTSQVNITNGFVQNGNFIITEQITFAIDGYEQSTDASSAGTTGT